MATANPAVHLPFAIRYAGRLQEKADRAYEADGKPSSDLQLDARKLRVAATLLSHGVALSRQHFPYKDSCLCAISF
jgi:hypothetical protein